MEDLFRDDPRALIILFSLFRSDKSINDILSKRLQERSEKLKKDPLPGFQQDDPLLEALDKLVNIGLVEEVPTLTHRPSYEYRLTSLGQQVMEELSCESNV